MSPEQMMDLMAYADGELAGDADASARVEALLASSDEARRVVASMQSPAVGAWLAQATEERADKASADKIADAVMLRVAAGAPAKVVPMRRRGVYTAATVGVLALAAAGVIWMRSKEPPSTNLVAHVNAPPPAPAPADESAGIEVDEVEAPARDVSVYYVDQPTAENTSTVVIWIGDESKKAP